MEDKTKILNSLDELILAIKKSTEYQAYQVNKKEMKENKELMNLIKDYQKCQRNLTLSIETKKDSTSYQKELERLSKELNNYPIYLEHLYLLEKLQDKISLISDTINAYFKEITNSLK